MTVLKQYNNLTSQWETIVVGKQGPKGFVAQTSPPDTTDVLWLDTDGTASSPSAPLTPTVGTALATTGTVNLDMSAINGTYQTIAMTGGITFTTSNRAAGRSVTIKLSAGGSSRSVAFPAWIFVGSATPTTLASGKTAVLTVTFFDGTDAAAVAAWAAQP